MTTPCITRDRRPTPSVEHAAGMLAGIQAQRAREGHAPAPFNLLDLGNPVDRRIIGSVYALMTRAALSAPS